MTLGLMTLCVVVVAAIGVGDTKTDARRAHLAGWLRRQRRQRWQRKPVRNDSPPTPETGTARTSSSTDNSDHFTAAAVAHRRRSRRDVHGYGTAPRRIRALSALPRILTDNDEMVRGLREIQQRLLIDRLLQSQRRRVQQKRLTEPKSEPWIIVPLSAIIREILVNRGICNRSQMDRAGADSPRDDRRKSRITSSDEIFMDKKASHRRRAPKSVDEDVAEQLNRSNALIMRRRRPPIDPMLLMVGIGKK